MAFGQGKESNAGVVFKKYVGVAPIKVLAVNPNKAKLMELGFNPKEEPSYINRDDEGTPMVNVTFIVQTEADKSNGIDEKFRLNFFLRKKNVFNRDKTKVKVMDTYARTAWVTKEEFANKAIPVANSGAPINISNNYRMLYEGEEFLTNFLKTLVNIPDINKWEGGHIVGQIDNPAEAEARLDTLDAIFGGNFNELNAIINIHPDNKVKALFGVRVSEDKEYQTIFNELFLKYGNNNYDKLEKLIEDRQANGAYSTTVFEVCTLKEYTVDATDFDAPDVAPTTQVPW